MNINFVRKVSSTYFTEFKDMNWIKLICTSAQIDHQQTTEGQTVVSVCLSHLVSHNPYLNQGQIVKVSVQQNYNLYPKLSIVKVGCPTPGGGRSWQFDWDVFSKELTGRPNCRMRLKWGKNRWLKNMIGLLLVCCIY